MPADHPWGHENQRVAAVIGVLQDWFEALENGTADSRYPDQSHERRGEKPQWTDEEIDRIIGAIDTWIEHEVMSRPTYWNERGFDSGSEFARLGAPQRRAMVQQLDNAMQQPNSTSSALPSASWMTREGEP